MKKLGFRLAALATGFVLTAAGAAAATLYQRTFDTKNGGASCYGREYTAAFRKKNPNVKIINIAVKPKKMVADGKPSTSKYFAVTLGVETATESYTSDAYCSPKGAGFSCDVESDGGSFQIIRVGRDMRISTRRIEIEGLVKDLSIQSAKSGPTRSFTLKRGANAVCKKF